MQLKALIAAISQIPEVALHTKMTTYLRREGGRIVLGARYKVSGHVENHKVAPEWYKYEVSVPEAAAVLVAVKIAELAENLRDFRESVVLSFQDHRSAGQEAA